jgi:hypothetical protein
MKKILISISISTLLSCGPSLEEVRERNEKARRGADSIVAKLESVLGTETTTKEMEVSSARNYNEGIQVVEVEGCEYLLYNTYGIIHKQNCKNH